VIDIPMIVLVFLVAAKIKLDLESHVRRHAVVLSDGSVGNFQ
jgi:hypothetical protein